MRATEMVFRATVVEQRVRDGFVWYTLDVQGERFTLPLGDQLGGPPMLTLGEEVELRITPPQEALGGPRTSPGTREPGRP
jgi:hypothetical protein